MSEQILIFGKNNINKNIFHKRKHSINTNKIDVKRIVISNIDSFGNKGFFG